jgi:hypothetical protein
MRTHTIIRDIKRIDIIDIIDRSDTPIRTVKLYDSGGSVFILEAASSLASELDQQIREAVLARGGSDKS